MSNEQENRQNDRLVTQTYKGLADERAPDRLNEKVLRLAAGDGGTRYSRARAWTRPLAWAATIALSFAIVLELSRLPSIEPEPVRVAAPDADQAAEHDVTIKDDEAIETRTNASTSITGIDPAAGVQRSRPATPAAERLDRVSSDEFVPQDMGVLREAEDMARAQSGPDQAPIAVRAEADAVSAKGTATERVPAEPVSAGQAATEDTRADEFSAAASFAAVAEKKELGSDLACPQKARESAGTWYMCIKKLREDGREDLADREYEALRKLFPDFVESQVGK